MNRASSIFCFLALFTALVATADCAQSELKGEYKVPVIDKRLLGEKLSMVNNERDEYATNLAAYAVKIVMESKGDQSSLDTARRILGLALHLS